MIEDLKVLVGVSILGRRNSVLRPMGACFVEKKLLGKKEREGGSEEWVGRGKVIA